MGKIPKEVDDKLSTIKKRNPVVEIYPTILNTDYDDGFVYRYFAKNHLTKEILEISADTYNGISSNSFEYVSELYQSLKIQWKLVGPYHDKIEYNKVIYGVFDTNKRTVDKANLEMKGIAQKLYDLTQFAKIV